MGNLQVVDHGGLSGPQAMYAIAVVLGCPNRAQQEDPVAEDSTGFGHRMWRDKAGNFSHAGKLS